MSQKLKRLQTERSNWTSQKAAARIRRKTSRWLEWILGAQVGGKVA